MVSTVPSIPHLPKASNPPCPNVIANNGEKSNTASSASLPPPTPIVPAYSSTTTGTTITGNTSDRSRSSRSGRWTPDEKLLFLHGLKVYGRGRWKKIRQFLPTRTLIQIKSHAQKVLKREESGDDIFIPLRTQKDKVEALIKDKSRLFQNNTPALSNESSPNYGYGKPLPTCPTFYRPAVNSHGIAPFTFLSAEKMTPTEQQQQHTIHRQVPPSSGHSLYHAPPPHSRHHHHHHNPPHHSHMYHHMGAPPPPQQQPINSSQQKVQQMHGPSPLITPSTSGGSIPQGPPPSRNPQSKTTDVLAATALCELFRGNSEEV